MPDKFEKRVYDDKALIEQLETSRMSYRMDAQGFIFIDPAHSLNMTLMHQKFFGDTNIYTDMSCPALRECGLLSVNARYMSSSEINRNDGFSHVSFENLEKARLVYVENSRSFEANRLCEVSEQFIIKNEAHGYRTEKVSVKNLKIVGAREGLNLDNAYGDGRELDNFTTLKGWDMILEADFYVENLKELNIDSLEEVKRDFCITSYHDLIVDAKSLEKAGSVFAIATILRARKLRETTRDLNVSAEFLYLDSLKKIGLSCEIKGPAVFDFPELQEVGCSLYARQHHKWWEFSKDDSVTLIAKNLESIGENKDPRLFKLSPQACMRLSSEDVFIANKNLTVAGKPYYSGVNGHGFIPM